MREHDLRAASTFFDCNNKFNTWRNPRDKRPHQIDHILILRTQLCHTANVKRKTNSVDSDHAALCIEFQLSNETLFYKKDDSNKIPKTKSKINNFALRGSQKASSKKKHPNSSKT
jgi:hypothetical protein